MCSILLRKDIVNKFNFGYALSPEFYILYRQTEMEVHLPAGYTRVVSRRLSKTEKAKPGNISLPKDLICFLVFAFLHLAKFLILNS